MSLKCQLWTPPPRSVANYASLNDVIFQKTEIFTSPSARISSEVSRDLFVRSTRAHRIPNAFNAEQVPLRLTYKSQPQISFPNQYVPASPATQRAALLSRQFADQLNHNTTQCPTYYMRMGCKGGRGVVSYILSGRQQHGHHVLVIPCTLHINAPHIQHISMSPHCR